MTSFKFLLTVITLNHWLLKFMRRKEMIANRGSFDCSVNSPCQFQRESVDKSKENKNTDVRM